MSVWILLAAMAAPPSTTGVVRVAYGATVTHDGAVRAAQTGELFFAEDRLATSADGYAEVQLGSDIRIRMSALTRVRVDRKLGLSLASGRLWVQTGPSRIRIEMGGAAAELEPRTSAIVERAPTGLTLAVRAGHANFESRDGRLRVNPGHIAQAAGRSRQAATVVTGGHALWNLVAVETRGALGDLGKTEAFLVRRALGRPPVDDVSALGEVPFAGYGDRISGSEGGAAGALLEEAVRPPPFFDEEVPPKGPNVRVDVTFPEE